MKKVAFEVKVKWVLKETKKKINGLSNQFEVIGLNRIKHSCNKMGE